MKSRKEELMEEIKKVEACYDELEEKVGPRVETEEMKKLLEKMTELYSELGRIN